MVTVRMRENPCRNDNVVGVRCLFPQDLIEPIGVFLQAVPAVHDDKAAVLQSHHIAHSVETADIVKQTDLRQGYIADLLHRVPVVLLPPTEGGGVGTFNHRTKNPVIRCIENR